MTERSVSERLKSLRESLPSGVTLVAVSKFHPVDAIRKAYEAGQRDFGESRAQELAAKASELPPDIHWHFIGHLQTNKVKSVVANADMIQSVDSLRLIKAISNEATKIAKTIDILLQVHIAAEETKTGFLPEELEQAAAEVLSHPNLRLRGIMGMATNTDDEARIREDFRKIKDCFNSIAPLINSEHFNTISMGMSDDRTIAIEEGSTMVRIGTDIFGTREY